MSTELAPVIVTPGPGGFDITGFALKTDVGTYNPGEYTYGEDSNGEPAARFWMANDDGGATISFAVRGIFDTHGQEQEHPKMLNCYLYCTESTGLSDSCKFTIEAEPQYQALGSPDDPQMWFECKWWIDASTAIEDVEVNSCGGTLVLAVNRYGATWYVSHTAWGNAEVSGSPGGTFSLEYRAERWK